MARKQLGPAPSGSTDASTKGYADTKIGGDGTVADIRVVTQAAYNALGAGRPSTRFYVIVG